MEITIRVDLGLISGIYAGLLLFGIGFNALVAWMERHGYMEGFTSLIVAVGTIVTLAPIALISYPLALIVLGGFVASGSPMIAGSISRYIRAREQARREIARLRNGYDPEGLAK